MPPHPLYNPCNHSSDELCREGALWLRGEPLAQRHRGGGRAQQGHVQESPLECPGGDHQGVHGHPETGAPDVPGDGGGSSDTGQPGFLPANVRPEKAQHNALNPVL